MHDVIARIRAFIGAEPVVGANAFLTTIRQNGEPFTRQVSTFVEGWTVGTIASATGLAVRHLRRVPVATLLYVEACPATPRRRNVFLRGVVALTSESTAIQAFLERRAAATGWPIPAPRYERVLLRFQPTYLRAEGFRAERYEQQEPAIVFRSFPPA